jgi:dTMP kinase
MSGKFIVFEGGEGGGKTTQLQRLYQWLTASAIAQPLFQAGVMAEVVTTREPGGTATGRRIRQVLLDQPADASETISDRTELLLYAADRAQHVSTDLRPKLAKGVWILCDRYTASTMAYQGYGRGLDLGLIEQLNAIATDGLTPDLTIWLDVPVEIGLARAQQRGPRDRMEQASLDFHQRVRQGFATLFAQDDTVARIDAAQPADSVTQHIQFVFKQWLHRWYPNHCHPPLLR